MFPLFFAPGPKNYACWLPVFLRNMMQLPETYPSVHDAFMEGKFVVQHGDMKFLLMALDENQEHSIKFLKEDSGAKGIYGRQEKKVVIYLSILEYLKC